MSEEIKNDQYENVIEIVPYENVIKIVPYERMNYDTNEIGISDICVEYIQDGDCTEESGNVQCLTLSTRNNGIERFINIKTDSWSIDKIDALISIIKDFSSRAGLEEK